MIEPKWETRFPYRVLSDGEKVQVELPVICANPKFYGEQIFPCGQCLVCRSKRRREWTARIMLEAMLWSDTSFVTLTYRDDDLTQTPQGRFTLVKDDLQRFFKRLRKRGFRFRYFAVGEYGSITQRPHYHVIFFGLGLLDGRAISDAWKMGMVHVGTLSRGSAQYCSGYVSKKMTKSDDPRLGDRIPEFILTSRRPGLGVPALDLLREAYLTKQGSEVLADRGDIMPSIMMGDRTYPLSRLLKCVLRILLDLPEKQEDRKLSVRLVEDPAVTEQARAREELLRLKAKLGGKL